MAPQREPEILPPHSRIGAPDGLFRDENLDLLSRLLDSWFHIPGTSIRFGLDGIVGLIPGIGDILAGLASGIIIFAAWARGAAYVTIARMLVNLAVEVIIGTVPFIGDAFDIAWKANRRNYALLTRHLHQPRRQQWRDWFFLAVVAMVLIAIFAVPILFVTWLIHLAIGAQIQAGAPFGP